jgi:transcription antitermination factor NusG
MSNNHPWWVIRVLPQRELETEKLVKRFDGYEAIAPYREGWRYIRKNGRPWKWPLFPGYLFVSWPNWDEGWNRITHKDTGIAWVYDFLKPVWWGHEASTLKPADVEYIKSIADGKYQPGGPEPSINVGDCVLILDGSFQGCVGTAKEISGKNATVDVPGMKMTSNVKIKLAKLEKV